MKRDSGGLDRVIIMDGLGICFGDSLESLANGLECEGRKKGYICCYCFGI